MVSLTLSWSFAHGLPGSLDRTPLYVGSWDLNVGVGCRCGTFRYDGICTERWGPCMHTALVGWVCMAPLLNISVTTPILRRRSVIIFVQTK